MKNRTKKSILQKIIIAILTVLLLSNFIMPTYSHAGLLSSVGGVIFDAITDLVVILADGTETLLQYFMLGDMKNDGKLRDVDIMVDKEEASSKGLTTSGTADFSLGLDEIDLGWNTDTETYRVPNLKYTPEEIFTGHTPFLQVNFISPQKAVDSQGNSVEGIAQTLHTVIAEWYVALRNLAIVGLLSVLVYVGIRIILSSTASDKAKYKQMFTDWLVAICLLFFLHYIMSFTLTLTESITQTLVGNEEQSSVIVEVEGDGQYKTNVMGAVRFLTQSNDNIERISYLFIYVVLIIYTVIFTLLYLKRTLNMAFLTVIAPTVALTYPIDKMNDGQAQAFNSWLKEFVFNALLQPFHLLIYYLFVLTAASLASNPLYIVAVLSFILPAEKILRNFFGFNKAGAGTLGALHGFAAANLLNKLGKGGNRSSGKSSGGKETPTGEKPPRFENRHNVAQIEENNNFDSGEESSQETDTDEETPSANAKPNETNAEYESVFDREHGINGYENDTTSSGIVLPESYRQTQQQEQVRRQKEQQAQEEIERRQREQQAQEEAERRQREQQAQEQDQQKNTRNHRVRNWTRAHNINAKSVLRAGGRTIGRVAKFATRTTFKAGAGTLAAAVTYASGGGAAGATAAFLAGSTLGGRAADASINLASRVGGTLGSGVTRVGRAALAQRGVAPAEQFDAAMDAMFGGTRIGQELDLANGNTRYQTAGSSQAIKNDRNNLNYVRDYMAAQNGGVVPSEKEVRAKMNTLDPYMKEGLTDIKDMLKAQKAEIYTGSAKQSAIIAAIGKEKGITADILNDDKKAKAQQANLQQDFINKGYSKATAAKQADYTINVLKVQNGVAHNLQKPQTTNTSDTGQPLTIQPEQTKQTTQSRQPKQTTQTRQTKTPRRKRY